MGQVSSFKSGTASTVAAAGGPTAATSAAGVLRQKILIGELPSGMALREDPLTLSIGVSRNTLREAFRQLILEGLLVQELYKGVAVRVIDAAAARDIFVARRALEFYAIERSAYAEQDAYQRLGLEIDAARDAAAEGDWLKVGTASLRFHIAVVALIGSPRLDAFFEVLMAQLSLALASKRHEEAFQARWLPQNASIYASLVEGRREAATRHMQAFIDESEKLVLDIVRLSRLER